MVHVKTNWDIFRFFKASKPQQVEVQQMSLYEFLEDHPDLYWDERQLESNPPQVFIEYFADKISRSDVIDMMKTYGKPEKIHVHVNISKPLLINF